MNITSLINSLPGACAQGLIWGIMAIGVYITYKILDLADLTVDGTMCIWGGNAGRTGYRYFPHSYGNSGNPCRNIKSAGAVFY